MTLELHSMQSMADVSIVGAAGYTGQETLDRVLGHPEPAPRRGRLRLARRAAGKRARPTPRPGAMPAFVTNDEALAHGADVTILCLSHEAAAAIEAACRRRRRRPLRRPPAAGRLLVRGLVRLHAPASRRPRRLGLRADRARRRVGAPDRESRVLRDGDPARARAAEGCDRARTPSSSTASPG